MLYILLISGYFPFQNHLGCLEGDHWSVTSEFSTWDWEAAGKECSGKWRHRLAGGVGREGMGSFTQLEPFTAL